MNYYINVKMGLGANVALARFISSVKNHKFYVLSPYWDVFKACPFVEGYYKPEETRDFILDARHDPDSKIIESRIYDLDGFIKKKLNYSEAWKEICGIPDEDIKEPVKDFLDPLSAFPNLKGDLEKCKKEADLGDKFVLVQFWGGQSPLEDTNKIYNMENEPLKRYYPLEKAIKFVQLFKEKYPEYKLLGYQLPNEPKIDGVVYHTMPYLCYYELAKKAEAFIAIDSSLQHLATGHCKGVVIWGHTLPEHFGYEENKNIVQDCRRDDIAYFTALGPSGAKIRYTEPEEILNVFAD